MHLVLLSLFAALAPTPADPAGTLRGGQWRLVMTVEKVSAFGQPVAMTVPPMEEDLDCLDEGSRLERMIARMEGCTPQGVVVGAGKVAFDAVCAMGDDGFNGVLHMTGTYSPERLSLAFTGTTRMEGIPIDLTGRAEARRVGICEKPHVDD